jgi:prepilin-type N-terminal cleavage/methylation domain-containing protein
MNISLAKRIDLMRSENNNKAFTLIELLVVIAIIALLLSILMPSLSKVKDHAKVIVCSTNLKTLSMCWFMYADDNDNKMVGAQPEVTNPSWFNTPCDDAGNPTYASGGSGDPSLEDKKNGIRNGALFSYVSDIDVYHCLGDKRAKKPATDWGMSTGGFRSYSIANCLNGWDYPGWPVGSPLRKIFTKWTQIRNPSGKYVFLEDADSRGFNLGSFYMDPQTPAWITFMGKWHFEKSVMGFADGHSEAHKWKDKRTLEFEGVWNGDSGEQPGNPDLEYMRHGWATY